MNEEWYFKEVAKLITIIEQGRIKTEIVARGYVIEKLKMIFNGCGIGMHTSLEPAVEELLRKRQ